MKRTKKPRMKQRGLLISLLLLLFFAVVGWGIWHHHEYQKLIFNFPNGSQVVTSRHNIRKMAPAEWQTFTHPVDENALHPCIGNSLDKCKAAPAIDFWPAGSEDTSNRQYAPKQRDIFKEIMGRITAHNGNDLLLKTSSGTIITIHYPLDVLANFNTSIGPKYPISVGAGDAIYVRYNAPSNQADTVIQASQIQKSYLVLANTNLKTDPRLQKY